MRTLIPVVVLLLAMSCVLAIPYPHPYPYAVYDPVALQPVAVPHLYRIIRETPVSALRTQRQAGGGGDHHDVVDYGAHTGHHGAFGWYADFPVQSHH